MVADRLRAFSNKKTSDIASTSVALSAQAELEVV